MTAHRFIETPKFRPLLSSGGSVGKVKPPTRDGMGTYTSLLLRQSQCPDLQTISDHPPLGILQCRRNDYRRKDGNPHCEHFHILVSKLGRICPIESRGSRPSRVLRPSILAPSGTLPPKQMRGKRRKFHESCRSVHFPKSKAMVPSSNLRSPLEEQPPLPRMRLLASRRGQWRVGRHPGNAARPVLGRFLTKCSCATASRFAYTDTSHEDSADCPRLRSAHAGAPNEPHLFGADRLKYPEAQKLEPWRRNNINGHLRALTNRIDEALDYVASEIERIVTTYGNEAIVLPGYLFCSGSGTSADFCASTAGTWTTGEPAHREPGARSPLTRAWLKTGMIASSAKI